MVPYPLKEMTMKKIYSLLFILVLVGSNCDLIDSISGQDKDSSPRLYPVLLNGEWGYINEEGVMIIEPRFQQASAFSDGLAAVRESWRWKYIDTDGEDAIETYFQEITTFSEGKAAVRIDGRWGYINTKGDVLINPRFRAAFPFSDGRAFIRTIDYSDFLYIDENGNEIESLSSPDEFNYLDDNMFANQRALVLDDDLYGYIDRNANTVIELKYSDALSFSDNLAAVLVSDRWGFIDPNGSMSISPQFVSAGKFNNGLAPARKSSNSYGFIDKNGDFVISEQFEEVRAFSDERAAVQVDGKWTFVGKTGTQITTPQFDEVDDFHNGLARVTIYTLNEENEVENLYGYINKEGKYVWFPTQ